MISTVSILRSVLEWWLHCMPSLPGVGTGWMRLRQDLHNRVSWIGCLGRHIPNSAKSSPAKTASTGQRFCNEEGFHGFSETSLQWRPKKNPNTCLEESADTGVTVADYTRRISWSYPLIAVWGSHHAMPVTALQTTYMYTFTYILLFSFSFHQVLVHVTMAISMR